MNTELKQRMNKVSARSLDGNVVMGMAEWNAIVNLVSNLIAEPVSSVPQDVEEFIAAIATLESADGEIVQISDVEQLAADWMAGHARVPIEPTEKMIIAAIVAASRKLPFINDAQKVIAIWTAMLTASKEMTE
jgi:hypothetical protein